MPTSHKLTFKNDIGTQPPLLEKIIRQYQEMAYLRVENNRFLANFNLQGDFLSFKGDDYLYNANKTFSCRLIELQAGYLSSGLINTFFAYFVDSDGKNKDCIFVRPIYSSKTGRITKLFWGNESMKYLNDNSGIVYQTTAEALNELVK